MSQEQEQPIIINHEFDEDRRPENHFSCHPHILLKESQRFKGFGLFAEKPIKKGEVVWKDPECWEKGIPLTSKQVYELPWEQQKIFAHFSYQIGHDLFLGMLTMENAMKDASNFWNHSCDPNCEFVNDLLMVASRDIETGDEVTFDYGTFCTVEWEGELLKEAAPQEIKCLCGSDKCRGRVTKEDWRNPELRERYRGTWPSFVQEMIDADEAEKNQSEARQ